VNKSQLIDTLAARYQGNRKAAAHALESVLDTITREVARGEKVAITGFGSFEKRVRPARWVRNPQTGERLKAKKTAVPKFNPGADLKNVISGAKKLPKLTLASLPQVPGMAAARKAAAKVPTATKAAPARKAPATKTAAKSTATSKSTAKKAPATKAAAKKAPAKKASATKAPATKTAAKSTATKSTATKSTAKKAPAKKTATTTTAKTTAKKTTAKKTSARKAAAKKA
jgi:DNA-binding protein HU-beta